MSFMSLILKNLFRQRVRTALTVLGISIGITTVVALGVVTESFKASAGELINFGGADFMVAQKGAADLAFSTVSEDDWQEISAMPGVEIGDGVLFSFSRVGSNPYFVTFGRDPAVMARTNVNIVDGRIIEPDSPDEVMIGVRAAEDNDFKVGDIITLEKHDFTVVGIYDSGNLFEDAGAYVPLSTLQVLTSRPGTVTAVYVTVAGGEDPDAVAADIDSSFERLVTISDVSEYGQVDQGVEILDAVNIAISLLAVGIGAIGVMNTMVMSVFERTREIGILRAVGWSGRRILRMIITESIALCLVAAVFGAVMGVLLTRAILLIDTVSNLLEPQYDLNIFIRAFGVAIFVALVGAIYPAIRAVRLTPMEALRYE
jgi:putative ABC transport system permease protein